jgi:uncharacterized Fe-S cluster-containing radical SAM superfamily enzyme
MRRSAVPVLVTVNVFAALEEPRSTLPKPHEVGETLKARVVPVPLRDALSGEVEALLGSVTEPF